LPRSENAMLSSFDNAGGRGGLDTFRSVRFCSRLFPRAETEFDVG
jgi:hypothetical protein